MSASSFNVCSSCSLSCFKVYTTTGHVLCQALKRWLEHNLDDEQILNSLIFRHDEFMTGGVSLPNLEAFIGSGGPVRSQFRLFEGARM